jgi:type VI protein secretion system component Hcp
MSPYDKVPGSQGPITAYVKIPDVQGRSAEISHLKWIETLSWHWDLAQTSGPGGSQVVPEYRECSFSMEYDAASSALFFKAQSGERIADVRVDFTRDMGKAKRTVMKVVLADVRILSVGGEPPLVRMDYRKVQSERV